MVGQMSLFELLEPKKEGCLITFDEDINEICRRLSSFAEKHGVGIGKTEFSIWDHVKQYGYRLDYTLIVTKEVLTDLFFADLQEIVDYAMKKNIQLSPMNSLFWWNGTASMSVFSTYLDGRKKRRQLQFKKEKQKKKGAVPIVVRQRY